MLKAIVIDDELYARDELIALLKETQEVDVVAACSNAIEGLQKINALKPDVIFLDIQMPQITGLEMLSMLDPDSMPEVVFVTAFDDYALKAFEENAFDYILKPIEPVRLHKTIRRLKLATEKTDYSVMTENQLELIPCAGYNRFLLLKPDQIEIVYSDQSGVQVISNDAKSSCSLSLKLLEAKTALIRCHRQYLVNPTSIREIKLLDNGLAEIVTCNGAIAPVSRRYLKALKTRFSLS